MNKSIDLTAKQTEYWCEELVVPLFWISYPKRIFQRDVLIHYKKRRLQSYYLNGRHRRDAELGYRYFSKPEQIDTYLRRCQRIQETMSHLKPFIIKGQYRSLEELYRQLMREMDVINRWNNLYAKTEAYRLEKFTLTRSSFIRLGFVTSASFIRQFSDCGCLLSSRLR